MFLYPVKVSQVHDMSPERFQQIRDLFERAVRERDTFFASEPLRSPIYVPLHRSARFARIVQVAGLDVQRVTAPGCC